MYEDDWIDYGSLQVSKYEKQGGSNVWRYVFPSGSSLPALQPDHDGSVMTSLVGWREPRLQFVDTFTGATYP